jgi:hypothetical protein
MKIDLYKSTSFGSHLLNTISDPMSKSFCEIVKKKWSKFSKNKDNIAILNKFDTTSD